jgi:hypothetical protein
MSTDFCGIPGHHRSETNVLRRFFSLITFPEMPVDEMISDISKKMTLRGLGSQSKPCTNGRRSALAVVLLRSSLPVPRVGHPVTPAPFILCAVALAVV